MSARKSCGGAVACILITLMVVTGPVGLASAQDVEGTSPANASKKTYGRGWDCDRGFRAVDGKCAAVKVPDDAHLTGSSHSNT